MRESGFDALSPRRKFTNQTLEDVSDIVHAILKLHHAPILSANC